MSQIVEKMRQEIQESSIIIISHQERIMQMADNIAVIADGNVADFGKKEEIFPRLMNDLNNSCGFREENSYA